MQVMTQMGHKGAKIHPERQILYLLIGTS